MNFLESFLESTNKVASISNPIVSPKGTHFWNLLGTIIFLCKCDHHSLIEMAQVEY